MKMEPKILFFRGRFGTPETIRPLSNPFQSEIPTCSDYYEAQSPEASQCSILVQRSRFWTFQTETHHLYKNVAAIKNPLCSFWSSGPTSGTVPALVAAIIKLKKCMFGRTTVTFFPGARQHEARFTSLRLLCNLHFLRVNYAPAVLSVDADLNRASIVVADPRVLQHPISAVPTRGCCID